MLALTKENVMKLNELKRYFKRKRIKDYEIANVLHITKSAYSFKINGKRSFSLDEIKVIQERFGMSNDEVVYFFIK